ncbi:NDP-hexose 2,3-dehydratase family protein [Saccharomonospora sp. CUA-673]|uniref:NDP-hexose 2,3-dehydratase family protein n=1 Tax=Saccharomonospora sp. CUA-673 TaxID=1904969 RepID=UPI000AB4275F|nr:NDP-hexose 2,3-dehydratase family protein [Saccharomonospora sp. CUA-673]
MTDQISDFHSWYDERARQHEYEVTKAPLESLGGWRIDGDTGDVVHETGRFFSVRGLHAKTAARGPGEWSQPIIVQPEIGILGIVATVARGEVHFLMQAKMEPGNINRIQLSPTVQATRSNYQKVHKGKDVPYLDYFRPPRHGGWVYDALQSEQGSWFLAKRNRNVIVEIDEQVPAQDDFRWVSLTEMSALLREPNLVNMDARTVLSGLPFLLSGLGRVSGLGTELSGGRVERARHSTSELLSWFTEAKSRHEIERRLVPLGELPDWSLRGGEIVHREGKHFAVIGVDVAASGREVARWSQPLFEPQGRGVIGFLGRYIDGTFHVLVRAEAEAGTHDTVEMAPTVSCIPDNYTGSLAAYRPAFLDDLLGAPESRTLVDVVHSEEGGRFYHAENRYLIVDVGEDFDLDVDDDFCWMTLSQVTSFIRHGNHVNVAARCLMSCIAGEKATLAAAV